HDADLEVDRPIVLVDQHLRAFEAAQPDLGIDLDMRAHARGTVADAFLYGARGALDDVLDREAVLDRRHALHREMRIALGRAFASLEDAGLVEMDMGVDKARADQPAATLDLFPGAAAEPGRNRRDAAILDTNVGRRLIGFALGQPH